MLKCVHTYTHKLQTPRGPAFIYVHTFMHIYIYIYVYVNVYIQLVISRAEWAEKHSIVEKKREEKGRGAIAMDVVEYREGQAVVQWMRFEAQRKGGASKHRTLSAETGIRGQGE